ncbi:DEAD/DEAH box helicase family protein [Metallibacterium scheffleri]|uniref:Toprim domain-containing protein n=1 Tax=Metallibacterium scheffleri TaxID=993689 RepID=A0A4S3KR32_9GAMM|nr:DEAD/DEAH box helicase [Metallibacterium scheffleri]THD11386.1 hypothetical protein B1806_04525 [Metallibacterium scheffleri]
MAPESTSPHRKVSSGAITAKAIKDLGLPEIHGEPHDVVRGYGLLAEVIGRIRGMKPISAFQKQRLPDAIATLVAAWSAITPPGNASELLAAGVDVSLADAWLSWLLSQPPVASRMGPQASATHSALLRYLANVERLTNLRGLASADLKGGSRITLALLRNGDFRPLLIARPRRPVVLLSIPLSNSAKRKRIVLACIDCLVDDVGDAIAVPKPPIVVMNHEAFFDDQREPCFDFDVDAWDALLGSWSTDETMSWAAFIQTFEHRWVDAFGKTIEEAPTLFGRSSLAVEAHVFDMDAVQISAVGEIYSALARQRHIPPLIAQVLTPAAPARVCLETSPRGEFLGHMDTRGGGGARVSFPLDPTQRLAAVTAAALGPASEPAIVPVNGPPGTGKTSFLRAVLASWWVSAAYEGRAFPPVVIATGATNKAISNVIDAFGDVADPTLGESITSRWLPGLPSYGWICPSQTAATNYPQLMHLTVTGSNATASGAAAPFARMAAIELDSLVEGYVCAARSLFSGTDIESVNHAVTHLHAQIKKRVESMRQEQRGFSSIVERLCVIAEHVRAWPPTARRCMSAEHQSSEAELASAKSRIAHFQTSERAVQSWLASDPSGRLSALGFAPRLRAWLLRRSTAAHEQAERHAMTALAAHGTPMPSTRQEGQRLLATIIADRAGFAAQVTSLEQRLLQISKQAAARAALRHDLSRVIEMLPITLRSGSGRRYVWHVLHGRGGAVPALWQAFDEYQDGTYRFALFHLSARYWEGRWLSRALALRADEPVDHGSDLQVFAMLGVVFVSTLLKLPALLRAGSADILVMDETGQCLPQSALGYLAGVRHALLVGDVEQLQPVSEISEPQSLALAMRSELEWRALPDALCASRGSMMRAAQRAASFTDGRSTPGVSLLYHYRCHPWIIGYCNALLYGGAIHAQRHVSARGPLPPLAWVDVRGAPAKSGSSWTNENEAREIASWLREALPGLQRAYGGKDPSQIVAVITPLGAQAQLLRHVLKDVLGDAADGMTIGTVHALQGAECPVVAFSMVQSTAEGNRSLFADRDGGHLMNVAVSRAKDSFILFGDRRSWSAAMETTPRSPIGQLGAAMTKPGERLYPNTIVVIEAPGKARAVQAALGFDAKVIATKGSLQEFRGIDAAGQMLWAEPSREWTTAMAAFDDAREIVVATDDDLAGELIGWQAARWVIEHWGRTPSIRRMRFHSVEHHELRQAFATRGDRFDGAMLRAALVRACASGLDIDDYRAKLPGEPYVRPHGRAILALVRAMQLDPAWIVMAHHKDEATGRITEGFLASAPSSLAPPRRFASEADALTAIRESKQMNLAEQPLRALTPVNQVPALYPANTTLRVLSVAAQELRLAPWETQDELNALYQEGAR